MGIDWNLIETWWIGSVFVTLTVGFIAASFVRWLFYEIMSNPNVQTVVRAANKIAGKGGAGVWDALIKKGSEWLLGK